MPFPTYDTDALRLLSTALSDAMDALHKSKGRALTETETSEFSTRLTVILMTAFDGGEREWRNSSAPRFKASASR